MVLNEAGIRGEKHQLCCNGPSKSCTMSPELTPREMKIAVSPCAWVYVPELPCLLVVFCLPNSFKVNNHLRNCPFRDFCKYCIVETLFSKLKEMPWVAAQPSLITMRLHCPPVTGGRENTETGREGIKLCEFSSPDKVMNQITTLFSEYLFLFSFLIPGISLAGK